MKSLFEGTFQEDGTAIIRGRLAAPDGTGTATGRPGEGNWVKRADVTSISWKAFVSTDGGTTWAEVAAVGGSLTVADVLTDTPVTTNTNWTRDAIGFNYAQTIAATVFATGGTLGKVEVKVTLTGSTVCWGVWQGPVEPVSTS